VSLIVVIRSCSVLGASDIAKVEAYLAHKWGL